MNTMDMFYRHLIVFGIIGVVMYAGVVLRNAFELYVIPVFELWLMKGYQVTQSVFAAGRLCHRFPGRTKPQHLFKLTRNIRSPQKTALLLACGLIALTAQPVTADESWSAFQNGGKIALQEKSNPATWKGADEAVWKVVIPGYGQSSPVVWNGRVYVTSVSGPEKETYHVTAFQLADGKQLWQHDVKNASPQKSSNYVSRAAPSPVVDEEGVICFFEGGNLVALSHENEVRWQRNLVEEYGAIEGRHGLGASVEQDADMAYVWVERSEDPYVLGIDKKTGDNRWKSPGIGATSWSSPRLVPVGEQSHLVLSAVGSLTGLDPKTGERLWNLEGISGNSTPTPIPLGDGQMLIGATVGRGGPSGGKGRAALSNGVVKATKDEEGKWSADYVWRAKRATSSFGSPIAYDGHAYFVNRSGVLYCLDLETGKEFYAKRLGGGSIWATPVAAGGQVLFFGKGGDVTFVKPGPEFAEIAATRAFAAASVEEKPQEGQRGPASSGPVLYAASVLPDKILIRTGGELICFGR